jgi:hypothetical protein
MEHWELLGIAGIVLGFLVPCLLRLYLEAEDTEERSDEE